MNQEMATTSGTYEPTARYEHKAVVVDRNVYVWAGLTDKLPRTHNSLEKIECLSSVDVLNQDSGNWMCQPTSGTPPLGVCGYACASVGDMIYFFGGWCGHGGCSHNGVHKLSTLSLQWESLSPTTSEDGAPMRKAYCGMVAFKDEGMDILFVVGGQGSTITCRQPGALYEENHGHYRCNEQHMFSLKERKWSLPSIVGESLPPCSCFTLTLVAERTAALFGGVSGAEFLNDLFVVELSRLSVQWTKISKPTRWLPIFSSVDWPEGRCAHATLCMSGPLLITAGGKDGNKITNDCWIYEFTTSLWKKLALPDIVTKRKHHSISALQLSPHNVLLVVFGGLESNDNDSSLISHTIIMELFQSRDGQWSVGKRRNLAEENSENSNKDHLRQRIGRLEDQRSQVQQRPQESALWQARTQQLARQNEQLQQQLQASIRKEQESQLQIQRLQQQLSRITIGEGQRPQVLYSWVVKKEDVKVTIRSVGKGTYGEVKVAKFAGQRVAAKRLNQVVITGSSLEIYKQEMSISAKIRHPNLVLFIGATIEGKLLILTELMPTSLHRELQRKKELAKEHTISISQDVANGLCYLHEFDPPQIHRNISSSNVLLEPLSSGWRAKVSDYGLATVMSAVAPSTPGKPAYAAPEARFPHLHSPKMDTFSYGVLLIEMYLRKLPESKNREEEIQHIEWPEMVSLIESCISENRSDRPSMSDIMKQLSAIESSDTNTL